MDYAHLERAVAEARVRGWVGKAGLRRQLERARSRPGGAELRALLDREIEPAVTRSEAERQLLTLIRDHGLPEPETNVPAGPYLVDFLWAPGA